MTRLDFQKTVANPRSYGEPPFRVAVVHGGPGAGGELAPVARELSRKCGVLEPLQTAKSVDGQVEELKAGLERHAVAPVVLIGFSWGAWLSYLLAARHPSLVSRLILVSSGPFEQRYVETLIETRRRRLNSAERAELTKILKGLDDPGILDRDRLIEGLARLTQKTDSYDPLSDQYEPGDRIPRQADVHEGVWPRAATMRASGALLMEGERIDCPVIAIHGAYDPHPSEGVRQPLRRVLDDFRLVLLNRCGHKPWEERWAREEFYRTVCKEIARGLA